MSYFIKVGVNQTDSDEANVQDKINGSLRRKRIPFLGKKTINTLKSNECVLKSVKHICTVVWNLRKAVESSEFN